ncbi:3-oxoacyl-[acyl-carrier-protein] reductase FabG [Paenibacillus solanacearum]|uniref:3-oxoacyl-[acyl-carrier-protein] reductase FabG n=1 Tax=Paenibacillus solanacearum TaxID=2048548 RepID=A0A916K3S2_9BACL|nr:3-oxoacyl-ACP reductase family protein [Paenibacillus solanacearum]CAG7640507.1 3-oxoacyl-[acyl-carrier-protein] reductase FabG [Paenibacillus solanacearum]
MLLKGKTAVVTGGNRGIGSAIAGAFAAHGAQVAVLHNEKEESDSPHVQLKADVSSPDEVERCFRDLQECWGRLDILVNNAGVTIRGLLGETDESRWDRIMAVNLKGHFFCTQAALKLFRATGGGCVINISSVRAHRGYAGDGAYIASKGGVEAFTRAMAVELAPDRIRVNCIAPGAIETDFNRDRLLDPQVRKSTENSIPLCRIGEAADVAGTAVYLASGLSAYVTGVTIPVDGGLMIKG